MTSRSLRTFVALGWLLLWGISHHASAQSEIIARGKRATALVEVKAGASSGSAFCIHPGGYFITNEHVIHDVGLSGSVVLVLEPGEERQKILQARVVRVDAERDLALLQVTGATGLATLSLGDSNALAETDHVMAFGYPFGRELALSKDEYPNITVSTGQVTSLRKSKGILRELQFDASVNPGSSGGPVLNASGHVIGVVQAKVSGTNVNFAIPTGPLLEFLRKPEIVFDATQPAVVQKTGYQDFEIKLVSFVHSGIPYAVTLSLFDPGQPAHSFSAQAVSEGTYVAKAIPVHFYSQVGKVKLTIFGADRPLVFEAEDLSLVLDGKLVNLSAIRRVEAGPHSTTTVTFKDGKKFVGTVIGTRSVRAHLGTIPVTIDLSDGVTFTVDPSDLPPGFTSYSIEVKQADQVVAEKQGSLLMAGAQSQFRRGMLLVCADECPTMVSELPGGKRNDPADVKRYVQNIARLFTGGSRGRFLIYSDHAAFGDAFRAALQEDGHIVEHDIHPKSFDIYDGVFTGGSLYVDRDALIPYIQHGGKVYLAGGCGREGPYWANLLRPFGMAYDSDVYADPPGTGALRVTDFGDFPLFAGVKTLYVAGISPIRITEDNSPHTRLLLPRNSFNLWALYVGDLLSTR